MMRRPAYRIRSLLILLGLVLLSACNQAPEGKRLRFGLASAPVNLDPRYATDAASTRINRLLYRRLVEFDERSQPIPGLATWTMPDPAHYRIRLQEGGREFSDGSRLMARDVAATYRSVLDADNASPNRGPLELIKHIEVLDPDTLDFHLSHPDPLFPAYLVLGILPASGIESSAPFNTRPVGSGAFELEEWPDPGRLVLRRRQDDLLVEFIRVADPTVRVLKLLRGEIDLIQNDLPAELISYLKEEETIRVEEAPGSNFSYLGFNLEDPVTGKLEVRQAIAHAIDRKAIIRFALGDAARPASALLPADHWSGHPELDAYGYNPDLSRRLLQGLNPGGDRKLSISYKTSTDAVRVRLATIIQHQLGQVGIDVRLQSYDWGTFYGDIKAGRFQMFSLAWVGIKTPDIFRHIFHSQSLPPSGANRGRFSDPLVDRLIERAEASESMQAQASVFRELQTRLNELLPYIPLWYEDHVYAARSTVEGYRLASDGNYDGLEDVSVLATK